MAVHLKAAAYIKLVKEIVQQVVFGMTNDDSGPQVKRPRLDSVIVRAKSAVPPTASSVRPGWSAGFLPSGSGGRWSGLGQAN